MCGYSKQEAPRTTSFPQTPINMTVRILVTEASGAASREDWDFIVAVKELRTWSKELNSFLPIEPELLSASEAATAAIQSRFMADFSGLRSEGGEIRWEGRVPKSLQTLLESSLICEKSNVHKSPYLDEIFQLSWATHATRAFTAAHFNSVISVDNENLRSKLLEVDPDFPGLTLLDNEDESPSVASRYVQTPIGDTLAALGLFATLGKGLLWLTFHYLSRFGRPGLVPRNRTNEIETVLVDYFFDVPERQTGMSSKYWQRLPTYLKEDGHCVAQAHIFVPHEQHPTIRAARRRLATSDSTEFLIDDFAKSTRLFSAVWDLMSVFSWFLLKYVRFSNDFEHSFSWFKKSQIRDLANSLFGTVGAANIRYASLFSAFAQWAEKTGVKQVVYVSEFQGWEAILVKELRSRRIRTIGYSHSTVRRLDLRGSIGIESGLPELPAVRPDFLAAHSYQDLENLQSRKGSARTYLVESTRYYRILGKQNHRASDVISKVLVVGGYSDFETKFLLEACEEAATMLESPVDFAYLPHPRSTIFSSRIRQIPRHSGTSFLDQLQHFDAVVCAAETSAAMEALLLDVPVTLVAPPGRLIASPVFGLSGVQTARSSSQLAASLKSSRRSIPAELDKIQPCHAHGGQYERWGQLLRGTD